MHTALDHPSLDDLSNRHSRWWHHFRTARWFSAVQSVVADPRYATVTKMHRLNAAMRHRQLSIKTAASTLKALMGGDPTCWDMSRIDETMHKIERLLQLQESSGRELLAVAVECAP